MEEPKIIKETPVSLHVNGLNKPALVILPWIIEKAIKKAKENMICLVGTKNTGSVSGMIGYFARMVTNEDLILIGFNSGPSGLTPHGSKESLWGTNPFTVGIPTENKDIPIILDMASSKMTFGDVMMHATLNKALPVGVSVDEKGNPTTNPDKAINGSQLPFEGHKGSGLAFIVEILAGPLVGSKGGNQVKGEGEWGSFFIVLNPELYRPIEEFKKDIQTMIVELKNSKKQDNVQEIFYPGEKSGKELMKNTQAEEIDVSEELIDKIKQIA